MSGRGCVVIPQAEGWKVALGTAESATVETLTQTEGATAAQAAGMLKVWLEQRGLKDVALVLALPSDAVLSAPVAVDHLPRRQRDERLRIRLEELIPLAAEELRADCVSTAEGALAVAAPVERLRPLVEALEQQGFEVRHICAASVLALQAVPEDQRSAARLALWEDRGHLDFLRLAGGRPMEWAYLADPGQDLRLRLAAQLAQTNPLRVIGRCLSREIREMLRQQPNVQMVEHREEALGVAAGRAGLAVLAGAIDPWIDLRRTATEETPVAPARRMAGRSLLVATAVLGLLATGGLLIRDHRYAAAGRRANAAQAAMFQQEFPGQTVPPDIRARLSSELTKLRRAGEAMRAAPQLPSALRVLSAVLGAIAEERWVSFQDIAIDAGEVSLHGVTRTHADADALADELLAAGLRLEPLRTRTLSDGLVDFSVSARWVGETGVGPP